MIDLLLAYPRDAARSRLCDSVNGDCRFNSKGSLDGARLKAASVALGPLPPLADFALLCKKKHFARAEALQQAKLSMTCMCELYKFGG